MQAPLGKALPAPEPIERETYSVWRHFTDLDYRRFEHLSLTDPHAWRHAVRLNRIDRIDRIDRNLGRPDGIALSEREHAIVPWPNRSHPGGKLSPHEPRPVARRSAFRHGRTALVRR